MANPQSSPQSSPQLVATRDPRTNFQEQLGFTLSEEQDKGLKNCLDGLIDNLESIGRGDLNKAVADYIIEKTPSAPIAEEECDIGRSVFSGSQGISRVLKRPADDSDTKLTTKLQKMDSSEDDDVQGDHEISEEDKMFMEKAKEMAMESFDPKTKVGVVIVNKEKRIVGKGWNRVPKGCKNLFQLERDKGQETFNSQKHLYVVYGIRAAMLDALLNKEDLEGGTVYTTLFPSNVCAQFIREVGITRVVYISDKFWKRDFTKVAKELLEGIKCSQMSSTGLMETTEDTAHERR